MHLSKYFVLFESFFNSLIRSQVDAWAPGAPRIITDSIFAFIDLENPRLQILDRFRIILCKNPWERRGQSTPWAPGAAGVLGDVIFVFSDPENLRQEDLDRFKIILSENPWGRRGQSTPWPPGAPGVIADNIFAFSDPENHRLEILDRFRINILPGETWVDLENLVGPKFGSIALLLPKLIIFFSDNVKVELS